jgi:predicted nucleic acid-binding protein
VKKIFADTAYWTAILYPKDSYHKPASAAAIRHSKDLVVTTDAVLSETLNQFSNAGSHWRKTVASQIENLFTQDSVFVLPASRADKEYNHVDCMSMVVMRNENITEVLSTDHHFEQEGFTLLLKP